MGGSLLEGYGIQGSRQRIKTFKERKGDNILKSDVTESREKTIKTTNGGGNR